MKETENSSLGKLLFTNGYLDLKTGKFDPLFSPHVVFFGRIPFDYVPSSANTASYEQQLREKFFYKPLGQAVGDYFLYNLACGLAGDRMKKMLFGLGYSGTGKSFLSQAIVNSCGDYADTFTGNNFATRNTGADEAAQNRWALLLRHKRLILSNELKMGASLDGNVIKNTSSGVEGMLGREHAGNETSFYPHFLCVLFANDMPKIKPMDEALGNRLKFVSYNKIYVDREPENEYELQSDPHLKQEMDTLPFKQAFLRIMIKQHWLGDDGRFNNDPKEVLLNREDWIDVNPNQEWIGISQFLEDFELTNQQSHYIASSVLSQWLTNKNLGISMNKFSRDLKRHCFLHQLTNVYKGDMKIGNRTTRVWCGIKRREPPAAVEVEGTGEDEGEDIELVEEEV